MDAKNMNHLYPSTQISSNVNQISPSGDSMTLSISFGILSFISSLLQKEAVPSMECSSYHFFKTAISVSQHPVILSMLPGPPLSLIIAFFFPFLMRFFAQKGWAFWTVLNQNAPRVERNNWLIKKHPKTSILMPKKRKAGDCRSTKNWRYKYIT